MTTTNGYAINAEAALDHLATAPEGEGAGRLRAMLGASIHAGAETVGN